MEHNVEFITAIIPVLGIVGMWLIFRPQQVENQALHQSIDNNTEAVQELTELIHEMKEDLVANKKDIEALYRKCEELDRKIERCGACGAKVGDKH